MLQQQPADKQTAAWDLHDLHEIQGIPVDICASVGMSSRSKRLYLPGCSDMLHKPCAAINTTTGRWQRTAASDLHDLHEMQGIQ
jgi:hypothetical protein